MKNGIDVKVGIHDYFVMSRLVECKNIDCAFHELNDFSVKEGSFNCIFKTISIDKENKCARFKLVDKKTRKAFRPK